MEMENETTALKWVFYREVDVPRDIEEILVTGEVADRAFKTVRDVAVFTNKRLIVKDVQGLTGTKVEMYSLPYSAVNMWSTEMRASSITRQRWNCGQEQAILKLN